MSASGPRLAPLPPGHSPELADQFASFFKTLGFVPNSVLTMQRKPALVRAFVAMQAAIWSPDSKVDRGLKRLIAFAASRATQDAYSMAHTASGALHFGIEPAKLAALADFHSSPQFTDAERSALTLAVAASAVPNGVTEESFAELRRHWGEEQIVEIVATIAMAGFLARWNGTMATPLEDEPLGVAQEHLAPHGWSAGIHGA
jgi:alkylhydroperoxidase family enzyme